MATQKPSKPNVVLPNNFGGVKTPYTQAQIDNGYQEAVPQVVDGGNINYEKDAVFQKIKYLESVADAVNNIPPGKFLVVNSNNQFEYADSTVKSSFGNIGDIEYTSRTDVPNGGAWCDGALYTKAQFPDVYQMLVDGKLKSTTVSEFDSKVSTNGSCGFFGLDTANERFKVPMLKDVYIKAGQAPSMFGAESLPNVKGEVGTIGDYYNTAVVTGAFKRGEKIVHAVGAGDIVWFYNATFNASRSSSTYKDRAKVQPDHVVYRAYVVLYTSAAEASVAQAQEFMTALSGKANTDLSNVSSNIVESKAVPVGAFMPYAADTPPEGWLKCDGSTVSRTTYSALFAKIGTKYGSGDGSKTFNMPNFINKTFWGGSSSGTVKAAELPNISGYISYLFMGENGQKSDGALSATLQAGNRLINTGIGSAWKQLNFSAKDSNAIYGKSSTVQPPALTTIICIKY